MKKTIISILIALLLASVLTGCAETNPISTKTVRVIGTATAKTERALGSNLTIGSVDKIELNGTDIKDQFVPEPGATAGKNNVVFTATVEVPAKTSLEASAMPGFVFDEWEVLDDEESTASSALLDKIEDWLDENNRKNNEKLVDIPAEYLPYIVAEYDNGYYVTLGSVAAPEGEKGTAGNPLTVDELIAKAYAKDELTLVISGTDEAEFSKLIDKINKLTNLDELKLKAKGATISVVPSFIKLEEIHLTGFTFSSDVTINNAKAEIKFEDCTFKTLTVENADALEIKGGSAETVIIKAAEEVELEDITIGTLDLSGMQEGEVELERVKYTTYNKPNNNEVSVEIEK